MDTLIDLWERGAAAAGPVTISLWLAWLLRRETKEKEFWRNRCLELLGVAESAVNTVREDLQKESL